MPLIPCEQHNTVHNISISEMKDLIAFYQSQWVTASYQPDAIPAGGSMSSEDRAYRTICPEADAKHIADTAAGVAGHSKATGHVMTMRRLGENFKESR